jgi:hypothetical protein
MDVGQAKFTENIRASLFNRNISRWTVPLGMCDMGIFEPICTNTMYCTYNIASVRGTYISAFTPEAELMNVYNFFEVSGHNYESS